MKMCRKYTRIFGYKTFTNNKTHDNNDDENQTMNERKRMPGVENGQIERERKNRSHYENKSREYS